MRTVRLHWEAEAEIDDAASWYESQLEGLGFDFLKGLAVAFERIARNPEAYPLWPDSGEAVDEDAEAAWAAEIERRVQAIKAGTARTVPWEEARARIQKARDARRKD